MARLGTALDHRREADPPSRALDGLGHRLAAALERRGGDAERGAGATAGAGETGARGLGRRRADTAGPLGDRFVLAFERRLTQALDRRLGGAPSRRGPAALEQRLVNALERRLSVKRRPLDGTSGPDGALARLGRSLGRPDAAGGVSARRPSTLRALVLGILARGTVRTLALLVRVLARGLISAPARRLVRLLVRRAVRAPSSGKAGFLGLLLGVIALLVRRLAGVRQSRRAAGRLALRLLGNLLPALRRLAVRLLRLAFVLVRRELRRAPAGRRGR